MTYLWQTIIYRPILNALIFFYNTIAFHNLGLAIIFATILLRLILYPLFHTAARQQVAMQRIQPHIKKIQELHKNDRDKQAQALMALYKEHGVNPFSSIILLIVQIPIMLGLYWVVRSGLAGGTISGLYSFVAQPSSINSMFLGFVNLAQSNFILICLAALAQYFQARLAIYRDPNNKAPLSAPEKMARQMSFIAPLLTIFVFYSLPAAVGLYWLVTSLFSIGQQIIVNKHFKKGETAAV
ncbi:MAG TPA: YidC/Oxa1 family membrane protein insertase [Candidatus Paceibacterota bacterium]|jgi:YidC/Oxa1 family membrane protein insertase|nr:YidC/Oxa1 family membrane protein insertase [Candidatus Paceibacterota bacterium]